MIEKEVVTNRITRYYVGGGKWLTQNYPTCYREWHSSVLIVDGKGADDWREADDAEKVAWEKNPPVAAERGEFSRRMASLGVTLNDKTGYYELNGLKDITEAQMRAIDAVGVIDNSNTDTKYAGQWIRTHLPPQIKWGMVDCSNTFRGSQVETIIIPFASCVGNFASDCKNLHTVSVYRLWTSNWGGCISLKEIYVNEFTPRSYSFPNSPLLSLRTCRMFVDKTAANNATSFSIGVHADVYAKLTGDTTNAAAAALSAEELQQWGQVLADAAAKSIVFTKA